MKYVKFKNYKRFKKENNTLNNIFNEISNFNLIKNRKY